MTAEAGGDTWVVNASPVILLGKVGQLCLLEALASHVVVPAAVIAELESGADFSPEDRSVLTWAQSRAIQDIAVPQSISGWDLGAGESQVLAHCLVCGGRAVLDDGEARAAVRVHRVRMTGTLGVILRARRANLIPAARPVIERLVERGAFLSDRIVRQALSMVGE